MTTHVVFIQGGGEGAHDEDRALAASLQRRLGARYVVNFPKMPNEGAPEYAAWTPRITEEIARSDSDPVLVGHSVGAYMLVKYLSEEGAPKPPVGIFLIAPPYPGGDVNWQFAGFSLPPNVGALLPKTAKVFLYHSPDDETVPFAHMSLYAQAIPRAIVRATTGGHQLNNDLSLVAMDIRSLEAKKRGYPCHRRGDWALDCPSYPVNHISISDGTNDRRALSPIGPSVLACLASSVMVARPCDVQRNDALAALAPAGAGSPAHLVRYLRDWTVWNTFRTIASLAACVLLMLALAASQTPPFRVVDAFRRRRYHPC